MLLFALNHKNKTKLFEHTFKKNLIYTSKWWRWWETFLNDQISIVALLISNFSRFFFLLLYSYSKLVAEINCYKITTSIVIYSWALDLPKFTVMMVMIIEIRKKNFFEMISWIKWGRESFFVWLRLNSVVVIVMNIQVILTWWCYFFSWRIKYSNWYQQS